MRKAFLIVFVFEVVKYSHSQLITMTRSNHKTSKSACDISARSSLIEHFFNIIFTEFHNTPPVCVCVQMCPDQPTYCYPNGCLKRAEKTKKVEVPLPVATMSENTKPIFFIDETNDFMNDFLTKNYIDDSTPKVTRMPTQSENPMANMRPDPFKDRYKILFKYKKMPKVELKYNLGEQVKNTKSEALKNENVDVSNTRWPLNKFDRRLGVGQRTGQNKSQKSTNNPRYFMSLFPEKAASYPPKYFKRGLTNNSNSEVEIKTIYVVGKSETESSDFSLEKLIDSLIESSFDKNATSPDAAENPTLVNQTIVKIEDQNDAPRDNSTKRSMKNETTNIISMNVTNENVDKNKYSEDITNNSNNVGDMIVTLSKRIERQNNTSLEIMKRITGVFEFESFNTTSQKPIRTTSDTDNETSTTEYTTVPAVYETRTTRKIRKRIVRRLQNSKNN